MNLTLNRIAIPSRNTFRKEERLKSKKIIDALFEKGKSIDVPPLKIVWMTTSEASSFPAQASFSVPKRNFQKAADRNRLKRLMRESYRLRKGLLYSRLAEKNLYVALMVLFIGKQMANLKEVDEKMESALNRFVESI